MRNIVLIAISALLLAGCFGQAPSAPQQPANATAPAVNNTTQQVPAAPGSNVTPPAPSNGTGGPSPAPPQQGGAPPAPQVNCATLTPNCGSCIAVAGCGWCKSSNSCLSGDASGPATASQCPQADWAVTSSQCQAPTSPQGTSCAQQVGCGNCLSGSGCKFCRQGAICTDASSNDSCFGGWITDYYVCAAGSQ